MTILSNKNELIALLKDPTFSALLAANSEEDLEKIAYDSEDPPHYQVNEDSDDLDGLYLFSTPVKSNGAGGRYGSTIHVIKLFGDHDYPFRIVGSEDTPWGNGIDGETDLGDFRTLADAVDLAFQTHEKGMLLLDTLQENEETGGYKKGPNKILIPEVDARSEELRF